MDFFRPFDLLMFAHFSVYWKLLILCLFCTKQNRDTIKWNVYLRTDENVLETEETALMVSGNQAGPKAPSESGKACPEVQNVKKIQWPGGKH